MLEVLTFSHISYGMTIRSINSQIPQFLQVLIIPGTGGQCQAGFKCGKGSVYQVPCPAGTYSDTPESVSHPVFPTFSF